MNLYTKTNITCYASAVRQGHAGYGKDENGSKWAIKSEKQKLDEAMEKLREKMKSGAIRK